MSEVIAIPKRIADLILVTPGCWPWLGRKSRGGYGTVSASGNTRQAHRVIYELYCGPVPAGLQLDHLCRVRDCVNPDHLEPVTPGENTRRGRAGEVVAEMMRSKTHCPRGHEYAGDNLVVRANGKRACRACCLVQHREGSRRYRAKYHAAVNAKKREAYARGTS